MKKFFFAFLLISFSAFAQTLPIAVRTDPISASPQNQGVMPEFQGITQWFNSAPLTKDALKGKVVLVDFWTYTCVNCVRTLPYLNAWHQKYKDRGLIIVGVHSPEFDFEKDPANVKKAIEKFQILYPVALDNAMATWNAYQNQFWPAHYFIDRQGKIRETHFGEGDYEESERKIQKLLDELLPTDTQPTTFPITLAQTLPQTLPMTLPTTLPQTLPTTLPSTLPSILPSTMPTTQPLAASTMPMSVNFDEVKSPETYLGLIRRERVVTSGRPLELNEWTYEGAWHVHGDRISLTEGVGKIRFRFSATRVNLVLHPGSTPSKAIVRLDGQVVPDTKAGKDVRSGNLEAKEPRLYELIQLGSKGEEHTIEIEFLTPGIQAYAFTFG